MSRLIVRWTLALLLAGMVLPGCRGGKEPDGVAGTPAVATAQAGKASRSGLAAPGSTPEASAEPEMLDLRDPESDTPGVGVPSTEADPAEELSDIMGEGVADIIDDQPLNAAPPIRGPKKATEDGLVVRGTVLISSQVPEPGSVPYTDCVTFVKYRVDEVALGSYDGDEILVVFWGMRDNVLEPAASYREGDEHEIKLVPFADRSELSQVMQADDTADYSLEPFFSLSCEGV